MEKVTTGLVFIEGILSFLSPCFLPLIPIYIGYLSGEAVEKNKRWNVIRNSLAFVLGFTIIFVLLGATASTLSRYMIVHRKLLNRIFGVIIILMGLFYMEIINPKFLNMEKRFSYEGNKSGFFGAVFLGMAVGFGWTPCIGPMLASVLAIAASKSSIIYGIYLLFIYSMGIAVPFLAAALLMQGASFKLRKILKYTRAIKIIAGVILIITGILLYTGYFERLAGYFWR